MIQIAHNAVHAKILNAPREALLEVHRLLSYKPSGSEHTTAFQAGDWDGRSSFFSWQTGQFPAGFVRLIVQGLRKIGFECQVVAKPRPEPLGERMPKVDEFDYTPRYDYHVEAVDKLVDHGMTIAQIATGGGKSRIARIAYRTINRPTLFLTTRGILMHQMKRGIEKNLGEEVAVLGDGDWGIPYTKADGSPGRRITRFTVAMVQTLAQRLERINAEGEYLALQTRRARELQKQMEALKTRLKKAKTPPVEIGQQLNALVKTYEAAIPEKAVDMVEIKAKVARHEHLRQATIAVLERFELVIAEEAHEVSSDSFFKVMSACKNAHYRLALTATPFMKDDEEANMRLLASCGPVAIRVTEKMLIERGILARPYFKFLRLPEEKKPAKLFRSTPWARAYEVGIVFNEHRNKLFVAEALRGIGWGMNAMMLVQRKEHGELLRDMLRKYGARVEFIFGENNQKERDRCIGLLAAGEIDVLIGSTILDVGVDVPAVGMILNVGGGKAEVAMRQRVGRGLREKHRGPNCAFFVDAQDDFNNHLVAHARERRGIIASTPGFGENIVTDFNFEALGFRRLARAA